MPYIVDRSSNVVTFSKQPINKNTNNYIPNSKLSQTKDPAPDVYKYPLHDLSSVFTHWDPKLCKNVPTPNELPGVNKNKLNGGK